MLDSLDWGRWGDTPESHSGGNTSPFAQRWEFVTKRVRFGAETERPCLDTSVQPVGPEFIELKHVALPVIVAAIGSRPRGAGQVGKPPVDEVSLVVGAAPRFARDHGLLSR